MIQASLVWGAWSTIYKEDFVIEKNRECNES